MKIFSACLTDDFLLLATKKSLKLDEKSCSKISYPQELILEGHFTLKMFTGLVAYDSHLNNSILLCQKEKMDRLVLPEYTGEDTPVLNNIIHFAKDIFFVQNNSVTPFVYYGNTPETIKMLLASIQCKWYSNKLGISYSEEEKPAIHEMSHHSCSDLKKVYLDLVFIGWAIVVPEIIDRTINLVFAYSFVVNDLKKTKFNFNNEVYENVLLFNKKELEKIAFPTLLTKSLSVLLK